MMANDDNADERAPLINSDSAADSVPDGSGQSFSKIM